MLRHLGCNRSRSRSSDSETVGGGFGGNGGNGQSGNDGLTAYVESGPTADDDASKSLPAAPAEESQPASAEEFPSRLTCSTAKCLS